MYFAKCGRIIDTDSFPTFAAGLYCLLTVLYSKSSSLATCQLLGRIRSPCIITERHPHTNSMCVHMHTVFYTEESAAQSFPFEKKIHIYC